MTTQSHIHLWKVGTNFPAVNGQADPNAAYGVMLDGGLQEKDTVYIAATRALNGKLHVHRLRNASNGAILHCRDVSFRMTVTAAQYANLKALQGEFCWYMSHNHPAGTLPDDHVDTDSTNGGQKPKAGFGYRVVLMPLDGAYNIDPDLAYWTVTINLMGDEI